MRDCECLRESSRLETTHSSQPQLEEGLKGYLDSHTLVRTEAVYVLCGLLFGFRIKKTRINWLFGIIHKFKFNIISNLP